jgi:protein TonB
MSLILVGAALITTVSAEDAPRRVSAHVAATAAISKVEPEYSQVAKQLRLEGKVDLEAVVDETGSVIKVETVAGNPVLARAAVEALKRWKFKPFLEDGKPTKVTAPVTFSFTR